LSGGALFQRLWVLHIQPILCVADCEAIQDASPQPNISAQARDNKEGDSNWRPPGQPPAIMFTRPTATLKSTIFGCG
jgi:hypothetical protein